MRGRIVYHLRVAAAADVPAVSQFIVDQMADLAKFEDPAEPNVGPVNGVDRAGVAWVSGSVRFQVSGSETTVMDRITGVWAKPTTLARSILAGSRVAIHSCSHDEPVRTVCSDAVVAVK